ncbi:MAG: glycoside hydrolase family 3 C-terminal domain-containing protein [Actinobacteria bacterium]|nr:glycoside hydrolase family 3 C-terminal domain-containing protein [Actinomycetota bacterium]
MKKPIPILPPFLAIDLTPAERAADLLARMTLEEKIGQMTLVEKWSISNEAVTQYFIGGVLSGGGGTPARNTIEGWTQMVDNFQKAALETRLKIPIIYGVDAVHGHGNLKGAVIFPHNIGLGAARDPDLVRRVAKATAAEIAATNIRWNYAPTISVGQDIRWGRTYEVFSENMDLVTQLGVAYLEGLQGNSLSDYMSVLATPKHYIGDGGTLWGSSKHPTYIIDVGDLQVDEATLRSLHLPPFQKAVEAGAKSIMISLGSWNGTKMHGHRYLLTEVLKNELGFDGFVVSDWEGINQVDSNYYTAVVTAINAGIDMNMVPIDYEKFIDMMKSAVQKGDISEERIDDAVKRIFIVKFSMGLFEQPFSKPDLFNLVGSKKHRLLAREAVAKSMVLLKNDNDVLPISKGTPLIFLAGEGADDVGIQCGGWTIEWQGATGAITPGTTLKEAFNNVASGQIQYNRSGNFDKILDENGQPATADVGIVVVAEKPYAEGMGDSDKLVLSQPDADLIKRVSKRSRKVVVIIISGRPLVITDYIDMADAWVAAWLPGTEGQGMADVIFGDVPFTGKTPFTWPASMDQLPLGSSGEAPLFFFGFGIER